MRELDRYLSAEMGVESEDDIEAQRVFETVYDDFERLGVRQEQLIQGGKFFDVVQTENTGAHLGRPYVVFRVSEGERQLVYKLRTDEDQMGMTKKEIAFLSRLAPLLQESMPDELKDKVRLPDLIECRVDGGLPFCLEDFFEGQIAGELQRADPEVLDEEDVEAVAALIRLMHEQLTPEKVSEIAPEIYTSQYSLLHNYEFALPPRKEVFQQNLGEGYYEALQEQLKSSRELVENAPVMFQAGDINTSNIIKQEDGTIGLFDWERVVLKAGPASDYGFMFATLWSNPEAQKAFFDEAIRLNQDIEHFREYFRLDFIYARGAVVLYDWSSELNNPSTDPDRKELAQEAVATISEQLKDAIDRKGIWAEEEIGKE